jgi:mannose-6-phosphate isomerase-like protein (cupin superfamily)
MTTKVTSCSHRLRTRAHVHHHLYRPDKPRYALSENEGEDFWLFGVLVTIKISAEDTAGRYSLIEAEVPPGLGSPWHVHRDEDEWFYAREGEFRVYVGDARLTLRAGGLPSASRAFPTPSLGLRWREDAVRRGA